MIARLLSYYDDIEPPPRPRCSPRRASTETLSLPAEAPTIEGGRELYAPGDFLHLNCSSYESKPAADLSWFINDQKADGSYVIPHPVSLNNQTGLYTARSELFLTLGWIHFNQTGQISVRCEASIGSNNKNSDRTIYSK